MDQVELYRAAYLVALLVLAEGEAGARVPLRAVNADQVLVSRGLSCSLSDEARRKVRQDTDRQGLTVKHRAGKVYLVSLTMAGVALADHLSEQVWKEEAGGGPLVVPCRFGGAEGRRLPREQFRELMQRVNAGELDLVALPADAGVVAYRSAAGERVVVK